MIEFFTEEQTLQRVTRLTRIRLVAFIEAEAVVPEQNESGPMFAPKDLARLDLLCDLTEIYDLEPEALAVMIVVIDQMHEARSQRRALLDAIRAEAPEVQTRIADSLARAHGVELG